MDGGSTVEVVNLLGSPAADWGEKNSMAVFACFRGCHAARMEATSPNISGGGRGAAEKKVITDVIPHGRGRQQGRGKS